MKLLTIISFFISVLFLSYSIKSEIIYENNIPKEYHGIWSDNCSEPNEFIIRIDEYTAYEIGPEATYFSLVQTRNIGEYLSIRFTISDWHYFLKIEDDILLIRYAPDEYNPNDNSFLKDDFNDEDVHYFNKCKNFPKKYLNIVEPFYQILESNLVSTCIKNSIESIKCISEVFEYFDVYDDGELTQAELTIVSRSILTYLILDGDINYGNIGPIEDRYLALSGSSFVIAPILSQFFIANYDYNNSDSLSLNELLNSKSNLVNNIKTLFELELSTIEDLIKNLDFIL